MFLLHVLICRKVYVCSNFLEALDRGHVFCLKFMNLKGSRVCSTAARYGNLRFLVYLHENGYEWDRETLTDAARNGHLNCLMYAVKNGCPWDEYVMVCAAGGGHFDCVVYLHENGCPWNKWACAEAALAGNLDCLKYLHDNGCPWDEFTCFCAAGNGQLDCLEYAYSHGCKWNESVCEYAATGGNLDCLRYAHENGCLWDEWTCYCAAVQGHLDCLMFAHSRGCSFGRTIHAPIKDIECFNYIVSNLKVLYEVKLDVLCEEEEIKCYICYTKENKVIFHPCNHKVCISCSNVLVTKNNLESCPFCRQKVQKNILIKLKNDFSVNVS